MDNDGMTKYWFTATVGVG